MEITRERLQLVFSKAKPFLAVAFVQAGLSGMYIISKAALDEGMSIYVFIVYRHAIATLLMSPFAYIFEKNVRQKMTISTFLKIMLLSLLGPVTSQNLYFIGMKYTTATFAAAMVNVLPAITFVMACCFRLEKVKMMSIHSQAKIVGTLATIAGAMIMTLVTGPNLDLPWTRSGPTHDLHHQQPQISHLHTIMGALMITIGCFTWAASMIMQAMTLRTYPTELSLSACICLLGTIEGAAVALVMEKGNAAAWAIKWDASFLSAVYSGILCSGVAYYLQGVVMKEKGPVFVTAFSPLNMIILNGFCCVCITDKLFSRVKKYSFPMIDSFLTGLDSWTSFAFVFVY